jgi:hypothetical protein
MWDFSGGRSSTGARFLRVLRLLPILISPNVRHPSVIFSSTLYCLGTDSIAKWPTAPTNRSKHQLASCTLKQFQDSYSGGVRFESRPWHRLSWRRFFVIFLSLSRQTARQCLGYTTNASFHILLKSSSSISHPTIRPCTVPYWLPWNNNRWGEGGQNKFDRGYKN